MTPRFALPFIAADQAQKHVPHNAALDALDALVLGVVQSATLAAPPASPAEGDLYILPAGGWSGVTGDPDDLAQWRGGEWQVITPLHGARFLLASTGSPILFCQAGWVEAVAFGPVTGAALGLAVRDAVLALSGASVTAAALIPDRCIVLGVTSHVRAAITGATSYSVGTPADLTAFGSALGIADGSGNVGVIGPTAIYAPTDVVVTAAGGDFTGGEVSVSALLILPTGAA